MTPAERKARERERKRAAGLVPVEVWVKVSKKTELEAAVRRINSVQRFRSVAPHHVASTGNGSNRGGTAETRLAERLKAARRGASGN
jgi:hypothetical protein